MNLYFDGLLYAFDLFLLSAQFDQKLIRYVLKVVHNSELVVASDLCLDLSVGVVNNRQKHVLYCNGKVLQNN